jgi:uncharacterized protein involved in exopolysaccharide biosynthesis
MELTYYFRIIGRRWPLVLIGLLLTIGLTVVFLQRQPLVFRSTSTVVVRPQTVDSEDGVRAIETLTRGVEITSTYATIARSDLIRGRATERLDPTLDTSGTEVSSEVVTATSILEISVTGGDREVVTALASAVAHEMVAYVGELQNVFELQILDEPQLPDGPIAPKEKLILGTGVVLGAVVGIVFALLAEAAARPARVRQLNRKAARRGPGSGAYDSRWRRSSDDGELTGVSAAGDENWRSHGSRR